MHSNPDTSTPTAVVRGYFDAVARGDLAAVGEALADEIVWHQPGNGSLSGTHRGKEAVFALLGGFMQRSGGSFRIDALGPLMAQGELVAVNLHFCAEKAGASLAMSGIDLLRVRAGQIVEVWLFSEDQAAEDAFWG